MERGAYLISVGSQIIGNAVLRMPRVTCATSSAAILCAVTSSRMASIGACIYRQQAYGLTAVARIANVLPRPCVERPRLLEHGVGNLLIIDKPAMRKPFGRGPRVGLPGVDLKRGRL